MADASRPQDGSNGQADSSTPLSSCHYEALGITAKDRASIDDIKKAYHAKSLKWHPDKNPNNPQATANFQRIAEAYNLLKDEGKRRTYNAKIWIEKVYAFLGLNAQPEANVITWVQNALQVPGQAVDSLIANRHCVQYHITPKMLYLRTQCAVDALTCHPPMSHDKSVILISGQPNNVKRAKETVELTLKEAQCTAAPSDGIVLIAPPQYGHDRVMQMSTTAQYTLNSFGGGFVSHYENRIMLRMCPRTPGVVAQFQSWMNFSATILLPDGRKLSCWQYAHWCETQNVAAPGMLPPDDPPDGTWVKELMTFALPAGTERDQSLLHLALLCLQQVPLTTPVIRAISSHPVHAEFSQRSTPQQKARFLCGLAHLDDNTHNKLNIRFSCLANLKVLRRLRQDLAKQQDSIIIRSRAFIAVKDAVPDDAIWHSWDELLKQDGALAKFFLELKKSMKERAGLDLPANWHEIPDVMTMILKTCGGTVQVDLQKGLLRTPEPVAAEKPKAPWDQDKSERTPVKETEDESESSLTSSERIEDAIYDLYDSTGPARGYLDMKEVVQHLEKRLKDFRKLSSSWAAEKNSFELQNVSNGSVQVKLKEGALECAEMRKADRTNSRLRQREMQVAADILPKLTENIPTNLSQTELCAILVQAGDTKSWDKFRPAAVLAVLVPEATGKQAAGENDRLRKDIIPFHASHLMRSIVRCEATCSDNKFKAESLLRLIHVSALDIFHAKTQGGKGKSLLPVVTESLRAMIHRPFSEVVKSRKPQIIPQCFVLAGYRALQEMSAGFVMSKTYSTFNAFAEFVQAIANFYSTFRPYMPEAKVNQDGKPEGVGVKDADGVVPQIVEKLKTSCQLALKQKNHPEDPQGLHRLVWTFANFGHEFEQIREPSVKPALQMLSELLCSLDFKEETGWTVMILAALVTSYRMAGVASEALFKKIASALTELVKKSAKFKRDHVMRTVEAFKDVGFPKLLDGFLTSLRTKQWFKNELRNSPKDDIAPLLLAMIRVKDAPAVEEFTNFLSGCSHVSEFSFKDISSLIKELRDVPASTNATNARGILWRAAMTQLDRKKTLPAPEDVENLLQVAQSESELRKLRESCEHGKRLETLPAPGRDWKELAAAFKSMLGPFSHAKERVERLEAACGARLMQFIDRRLSASSQKARSVSIQDLAPASLEIPAEALAGMPALAALIVKAASKEEIPTDDAGKSLFIKLVSHLHKALKQAATHPDEEFERWVKHAEAAVDPGASLKIEFLEQTLNKKPPPKLDKASQPNMKEALGQNWCAILLARSQKLGWTGGNYVTHEPTRPRASLRALATTAKSLLGPLTDEVLQLEEEKAPETQAKSSPTKKPAAATTGNAAPTGRERSRSRDAGRVAGPSPTKRTSTELAKTTDVPMPPAKKGPKGSVAAFMGQASKKVMLTVEHDKNQDLADMVAGKYCRESVHHNKDVFKRSVESDKDKDKDAEQAAPMFLYFWDHRLEGGEEDDGGWWFGTEVGGEQVLLQNRRTDDFPPSHGWIVVATGAEDTDLKVTKAKPPPKPAGPVPSKAKSLAGAGPTKAPPTRQPTAAPDLGLEKLSSEHAALKQWLSALDGHKGALLTYFDVLVREFDGDLQILKNVKTEPPEGSQNRGLFSFIIDDFWATINVTKIGHKTLLAKGIRELP